MCFGVISLSLNATNNHTVRSKSLFLSSTISLSSFQTLIHFKSLVYNVQKYTYILLVLLARAQHVFFSPIFLEVSNSAAQVSKLLQE